MTSQLAKIYLVSFFLFFISMENVSAQFVTIPDNEFANYLTTILPFSAINGNQLDTTDQAVVNLSSMNFFGLPITSIIGVEYFPNLTFLNCEANQITLIDTLPVSLVYFYCSANSISSLPNQLPQNLIYFECSDNSISNLPALPQNLEELSVEDNFITSLPNLPASLTKLDCSGNNIISLPVLPNNLEILDCSDNLIDSLQSLPVTLTKLDCFSNELDSLPSLPQNLLYLNCDDNSISFLPTLPPNLESLGCNGNNLTTIPSLPASLIALDCGSNNLLNLPTLPSTLWYLYCENNSQLSALPQLPNGIRRISCTGNTSLLCFPELPSSLLYLYFANTQIQCLQNLVSIPNSFPLISSLPLCDNFNPNNCDVFFKISGTVYPDTISNCIIDSSELISKPVKILVNQSGILFTQCYSTHTGRYAIDTPLGTYDYTVDTANMPFLVSCPVAGIHNSFLTTIDSTDFNMDFGLECKPGFDIGVNTINHALGNFSPGDTTEIKFEGGDLSFPYNLNCASGVSGNIEIIISGPAQYLNATTGSLVPLINGDTLVYAVADFGAFDFYNDIAFNININTNAQINQQVCFDIKIIPLIGDNNPENNQFFDCFDIVNSYDPNDKIVYPNGDITVYDEWLYYTIRFQNTGNAPAKSIVIIDTLRSSLNQSSFVFISSSHNPIINLNDSIVLFNFPQINLPHSAYDEPGSHGYIQYKIKPSANLQIGSVINNEAAIYFDYNLPVITNQTVNTLVAPSTVLEISDILVSVFPNPFNDNFTVDINRSEPVEFILYDIMSVKILHEKFISSLSVNTEQLSGGIYIYEIRDKNGLWKRGKIVKN